MRRNRKRRIRRLWLEILAAVLVLAAVSGSVAALMRFQGEDAVVVIRDGGESDGRLRVLLRSLGTPDSLSLRLSGPYTVEGDGAFRFAQDTELVIAADSDSLWLQCGGVTLNMGNAFTLQRALPDTDVKNGLYIAETGRSNLYVGDAAFSLADGGIAVLLYMDVEEYLYGVVPYEMSDIWPLEALKAQAVAARTYALERKSVRAGMAYDVVDTTADQVFRGLDSSCVHAIEAVDATRGIVGMYKGAFATCYYGASNGGQTALPADVWRQDGDYGYLAVVDDPYDLENPYSVTRSISFMADGQDMEEALETLLKEGLAPQLEAMGFSAEPSDIAILAIENIEPADPVGTEGSRMAATLLFTVRISGRRWSEAAQEGVSPAPPDLSESGSEPAHPRVLGGPEELPEPFTVAIGTYTQLKGAVPALAINSGNYELFTVVAVDANGEEHPVGLLKDEEPESAAKELRADEAAPSPTDDPGLSVEPQAVSKPTAWRIESRRFGHGVGMSQRGAQMMAGQHGASYTDILLFYYPGMELVRYSLEGYILQPLEKLPSVLGSERILSDGKSPAKTPAPLPALEEGEYYATVVLMSDTSSLNVRREANAASPVIGVLANGQRVIVREEQGDWLSIRTAELEGYAAAEYLSK